MNLRRLQYFVKCVDLGSLNQAAEVLFVAQPALSQQLSILEGELKQPLLVRSRKGVVPTEAGKVLYRHAQNILRQCRLAHDDVQSACVDLTGSVTVGLAQFSMMAGEVAASWMIGKNYQVFAQEGTLPAGGTRVLATTQPFDHCNLTTAPGLSDELATRFRDILLGMSWDDPLVRPLLELEGLKAWQPGRDSGYTLLERAVTDEKFYDAEGRITETKYNY